MSSERPRLLVWIAACSAAEATGMLAAAAAAQTGQALFGEPETTGAVLGVVALSVLGGIVEGLALAFATATALRNDRVPIDRNRWITLTTVVAALAWAAGSTPGALSGDSGSQPAIGLIVLGAAAIGVISGALMGAAQSVLLREAVRRPRRWITGSALAWAPAMAIIFAGATWPDENWPVVAVLATGIGTGALAGAALGALLGLTVPALMGTSPAETLLTSPFHRLLPSGLVVLAVRGRRSGTWYHLPVMTRPTGAGPTPGRLVAVGNWERKTWWRNLSPDEPRPVRYCRQGRWHDAQARTLLPQNVDYASAAAAYGKVPPGTPLVLIDQAAFG